MRIIRVFPRKTNATPTDSLSYIGGPTIFAEADEVHISVSFSWDLPEAERLEKEWRHIAPVKIGGPATVIARAFLLANMEMPSKAFETSAV